MCTWCLGLYQAVVWAKKDLLMVYNRHQVCRVMPSSSGGKDGPPDGLQWVSGMCGI